MKKLIKQIVEFTAFLVVLPAYGLYRLGAMLAGSDKAFPGWSETFSLLPGLTGQYLRRAFYSLTLERCGEKACLSFGAIFSHSTASVGANVYVGSFCSLGAITLEDDVLIASNVSIMNGTQQHGTEQIDIPIREQPGVFTPVTIGEGSWIGDGFGGRRKALRHWCRLGRDETNSRLRDRCGSPGESRSFSKRGTTNRTATCGNGTSSQFGF
jgi:hypothetical protein